MIAPAANNEPCAFCAEVPASGAWGKPCPDAPDHLHWSVDQLWQLQQDKGKDLGRYVSRAAYELEKAANAVDALPSWLKRRVLKVQPDLSPGLLRNEAERARDILHLMGLLDV